jgi:hypothetical protein
MDATTFVVVSICKSIVDSGLVMMQQQKLGILQDIDPMLVQRLEPEGRSRFQEVALALHGEPDSPGSHQAHLGRVFVVSRIRHLTDASLRREMVDFEIGKPEMPAIKAAVGKRRGFCLLTMGHLGHADQFAGWQLKDMTQRSEGLDRRVAVARFDLGHGCPGNHCPGGQFFGREPPLHAECLDN